jgi:hypothetical protein
MITFYDDGPICVTDRWFINGPRRYPINHLRNPRTTYKSRGLSVRRFVISAVSPLLVPAAMGPALPTAITVAISVAIILITLVTGMVRHRRSRVHILLADFRGTTVRLYQTSDKTEFGKLVRALARAYTYHRYSRRTLFANSRNDSCGGKPRSTWAGHRWAHRRRRDPAGR